MRDLLTSRERQMVALNPKLRFGVGALMRQRALEQASKYQKLSCREGGQFDKKFLTKGAIVGGPKVERIPTCRWTVICERRQARKQVATKKVSQ